MQQGDRIINHPVLICLRSGTFLAFLENALKNVICNTI